jgi:hypothetical protein
MRGQEPAEVGARSETVQKVVRHERGSACGTDAVGRVVGNRGLHAGALQHLAGPRVTLEHLDEL